MKNHRTWGKLIGAGVNGYLQARCLRGFILGVLGEAAVSRLRPARADRDPLVDTAYRVGVDVLRGALLAGRAGMLQGLLYGQLNTIVGHAAGWLTSGFNGPRAFRDGVFFYEQRGFFGRRGAALALGNVICGPAWLSQKPDSYLYRHEMCHVHHPVEQALGALYIPVHLADLLIGRAGEKLGKGYRWYVFEEHLQTCPYSHAHPHKAGVRA